MYSLYVKDNAHCSLFVGGLNEKHDIDVIRRKNVVPGGWWYVLLTLAYSQLTISPFEILTKYMNSTEQLLHKAFQTYLDKKIHIPYS